MCAQTLCFLAQDILKTCRCHQCIPIHMFCRLWPSLMCLRHLMSLTATLFLWTLWLGWMWRRSTSASDMFRIFSLGVTCYPLFLSCSSFFSCPAPIKGSYFRILQKTSWRPVDCQSTQLCSHRHWSDLLCNLWTLKQTQGAFNKSFTSLKPQPIFLGRVETKAIDTIWPRHHVWKRSSRECLKKPLWSQRLRDSRLSSIGSRAKP